MPTISFDSAPPRDIERVGGTVAVNVTLRAVAGSHVVPWLALARACNLMYHAGAWDSPESVQWLALEVLPSEDGRETTHVEWHHRDYRSP